MEDAPASDAAGAPDASAARATTGAAALTSTIPSSTAPTIRCAQRHPSCRALAARETRGGNACSVAAFTCPICTCHFAAHLRLRIICPPPSAVAPLVVCQSPRTALPELPANPAISATSVPVPNLTRPSRLKCPRSAQSSASQLPALRAAAPAHLPRPSHPPSRQPSPAPSPAALAPPTHPPSLVLIP